MSLGLVVSPGSMPSAADLSSLRPPFLRSIVYSYEDVERLVDLGLPIMLVVNSEMREADGGAAWEEAIEGIVERSRGQIFCVTAWNELDAYGLPPEFAASMVQRAAPILHAAGIKIACTSVAGPNWQSYLAEVSALCRGEMDYADLHPYGQRPDGFMWRGWGFGDLRPAVIRAYELSERPVICSEIGIKIGEAGGEDGVSQFLAAADRTLAQLGPDVCPYAAWFAWHDGVGAPAERDDQAFGLMSEYGDRRAAWNAFAALNEGREPILPVLSEIDAWEGRVGAGLLNAMESDGVLPAWEASRWPEYGEVVKANNGEIYVWLHELQRVIRVPSEAA